MKNPNVQKSATPRKWPRLSKRDQAAVKRMCEQTDWNAFWAGVMKRVEPQIDAYRKASARSMGMARSHVFRCA